MRELIPWIGDRQARKAWDTIFSREVLGSIVIGSASGKLVENLIALGVLLTLGPGAHPVFETLGYIVAWGVALPVGVYIFVYWHRIMDKASETAEQAAETAGGKASEAAEKAKDAAGDGNE